MNELLYFEFDVSFSLLARCQRNRHRLLAQLFCFEAGSRSSSFRLAVDNLKDAFADSQEQLYFVPAPGIKLIYYK